MSRDFLPWSVAVVSALIAAAAVLESALDPALVTPSVAPVDGELVSLRARLATQESEAEALRTELDRLRAALSMKQTMDAQLAVTGEDQKSPEQRRCELSEALDELPDIVPRLVAGTEAAFGEMRDVFLVMARAPMDDPSLFREAYEKATDPLSKTILLPHLLARDRESSAAFIKEELAHAEDPQLRGALIERIGMATDVKEDPEAQQIYLEALADGSTPQARRAAVKGLAGVESPEAEEALLRVADGDSDPELREAAIRSLAENPSTRDRVLGLLADEPDERLRTIGECSAALAGTP